jgi:hypothetical protein
MADETGMACLNSQWSSRIGSFSGKGTKSCTVSGRGGFIKENVEGDTSGFCVWLGSEGIIPKT